MNEYYLADDLSGALDAAAAFHAAGRRVVVLTSAADWRAPDDETVVGLTTETRNAPPEVAAGVVGRVLADGRARGARLVYKKIDSTLRGAVAAEMAAVAEALPATRLLFCPANPAVGRTVRGGVLHVHGVPVSATEFAHDPVSPVRESDLRRLLGHPDPARIVIPDAETPADLAAAVAANRAQAARLARERGVPLHELRLAAPAAAIAEVVARLRSAGAASLLVEAARHDSAVVRRTFAATAVEIITRARVERIFLTGGETAFALCGALGLPALEFEDELEPGLSLARASTPRGAFRLAVKPGGFGTEQTWLRAWDSLNQ